MGGQLIAIWECGSGLGWDDPDQQPWARGRTYGKIGGLVHTLGGKMENGESVTGGEFHFVAKIIYRGSQIGCTGSLIAENKVLTAAHCIGNYSVGDISVAFGNRRTEGTHYQATKIDLHPNYSIAKNDIATIEFSPPVSIQPVRILPQQEEEQYIQAGQEGVAVGWGRTSAGDPASLPDTLQKIVMPVYTSGECQQELDKLRRQGKDPRPPEIHLGILCAGQENKAPADGDSGSPLLVQAPDGWAQVGVMSQSTKDPTETVVYMGNYMRTSLVHDWIYAT